MFVFFATRFHLIPNPIMSFAGAPPGGSTDSGGPKQFYCHKCLRTISVTVSASSEPNCPLCHDGFLEEIETPYAPNPNLFSDPFSQSPFSNLLPLLFHSSSASFDLQNPNSIFGHTSQPGLDSPDGNSFNGLEFLRSHIQNLQSGGARFQFVIDNNQDQFRLPGNFGDYFFGPGLEQLIQQLAENDPNRYGTPPASKSAIDGLPTVRIAEESSNSEMNQCAVCKDEFEKGAEVKQMPCKHLYHDDCIIPWLQLHNSCPVCRYELPTDDAEYEGRTRGGGVQDNEGHDGGENRSTERRVRISLPWLFGGGRQGSSGDGGAGGSQSSGS